MTQTTQLRTRYARIQVVGIIALFAVMAAGAAWTKAPASHQAMDVSAIMSSVDTGSLPVQGHIDAF